MVDTLCDEDRQKLWKNYYNGSLVVKGKRGVYIDWEGNEWPLYPGAFLQHLPEKYHILRRDNGRDWCECCIWLPLNYYEAAVAMGIIDPDVPVSYPGVDLGLIEKFRRYQLQFEQTNMTQINKVVLAFFDFFEELRCRAHMHVPRNPHQEMIEEIQERLSGDFDQEIDINQLIAKYPASPSNLRRMFRKYVGCSMAEFRLARRMDMAAHYLVEHGLPIKEVALLVGYSDRYAFSKQFKKVKGLTPKEYVRQYSQWE